MTSLVPGLGNRQLHFFADFGGEKIILRAGPELKFENYESVQERLQFSGIKKGTKISFHSHFKGEDLYNYGELTFLTLG